MLTNTETRKMIRHMKACGIKYVDLYEKSGIGKMKFDSFFYHYCNMKYKYLILLLGYIAAEYPHFLEEYEDYTDYWPLIEHEWFREVANE